MREILARVGDPEPDVSAGAFSEAARHPDLAASAPLWSEALLRSARPGAGARMLRELAGAHRERLGVPLAPEHAPTLPLVLGSSPFLARLLLRHPEWCADLVGDPPGPPASESPEPDWTAVRRAKYRGLLRVAARDLAGRAPAESLGELSDLADGCLDAALRCTADATGAEPPVVFALGKLGGRELNFSSDLDLLMMYDAPEGEAQALRNQQVTRFVRHLRAELERPTEDGFAYRVDLELRPEGRAGALVNSVEAALDYYESFGAEWERQALIRLRHVGGPCDPARAFVRGIEPFVYRRTIGPEVLQSVRAMKMRIETERRDAGRDVDADLKEGAGGIRDVEFLVQALQLFFGGREAELRTGNVLDALERLAACGVLPGATAAALRDAYGWLRRAEHAVQLPEERQTHAFPRAAAAQLALARRMGYADPEAERARGRLLEDWTAVRGEVRAHFDRLVLEAREDADPR